MKPNAFQLSWWSAPLGRLLAGSLAILTVVASSPAQDAAGSLVAQANPIVTAGQLTQDIRVTFSGAQSVDRSTLGDGDLTVTGPPGYSQRARLISVTPENSIAGAALLPDGILPPLPAVVATYRVFPSAAHDGPWSPEQNGPYLIYLNAGEITTASGAFYAPGRIGSFAVALNATTPPMTAISVNTTNPANVTATVRTTIHRCLAIVDQTVQQDGRRFVLSATTLPLPCAPPADPADIPETREDTVTFSLGSPAAGVFSVVFLLDGTQLASTEFKIEPAAPLPAEVRLAVNSATATGVVAEVTIQFGDHYRISSQAIRRDGNRIFLTAVPDGPLPLMGPLPPQPVTLRYALGALPAGSYTASFAMREHTYASAEFKVTGIIEPPPAAEVALRAETSGLQPVLHVSVDFADPYFVITDQGAPHQDGYQFTVAATAVRAEFFVEPDGAPVLLSYPLGRLDRGNYSVAFQLNGTVRARTVFTVTGPPPPPVPHVAAVTIHEGDASRFAEVSIVLDQPGLRVLDWGQVRRTENTFAVEIVVGISDATDPADAPGATPDGFEIAANGDPLVGGFPVRIVSHTYPLGVLSAGAYSFNVTSGGATIARKPFLVSGRGPSAVLRAADVVSGDAEVHRFTVSFADPDGLNHDSIRSAAVTVSGPEGYSATASLREYARSENIPSTAATAVYSIIPPGGRWDAADNGRYRISIDAAAVRDRLGNALAEPALGSFSVRILPTVPLDPSVDIATRLTASGEWVAGVRLTAVGVQVSDWGQILPHGSVLLALATAERSITLDAMPVTHTHTYNLGSLSPGHYRFVFKTSLGHCGQTAIEVPGVIRDPLEAIREGNGGPDAFRDLAFALPPGLQAQPDISPELVPGSDGRPHPGLRYRRLHGADIQWVLQCSADMRSWHDAGDNAETLDRQIDIDGTESVRVCLRTALSDSPVRYLRIVARPAAE